MGSTPGQTTAGTTNSGCKVGRSLGFLLAKKTAHPIGSYQPPTYLCVVDNVQVEVRTPSRHPIAQRVLDPVAAEPLPDESHGLPGPLRLRDGMGGAVAPGTKRAGARKEQ